MNSCRGAVNKVVRSAGFGILLIVVASLALSSASGMVEVDLSKAQQYLRELQTEKWCEGQMCPAAYKLAALGKAAVPVLIGGIQSKNGCVVENVRFALATIGQPSIPSLQMLSGTGEPTVRCDALRAFDEMSELHPNLWENIMPAFLSAIRDSNPEVRKWGYYGLNHPGKGIARILVKALLRDESPIVREQAALSLRVEGDSAGDAIANPSLLMALKDSDATVRGGAAEALGDRNDKNAIATLGSLRSDPSPDVRYRAVGSLALLCDRHSVAYLVPFLDDTESLNYDPAADDAESAIEKIVGRNFGNWPAAAITAKKWWDAEGQKLYGNGANAVKRD